MFHTKSILIYFGIFDLPDFTCLAATLPYLLLSPKCRYNVISYFRVILHYTRHMFIFFKEYFHKVFLLESIVGLP